MNSSYATEHVEIQEDVVRGFFPLTVVRFAALVVRRRLRYFVCVGRLVRASRFEPLIVCVTCVAVVAI